MEFKKERVYSAVNADELKPGDKVIVANTIKDLRSAVDTALYVYELTDILTESSEDRFFVNEKCYLLAYLVERAENCTNCGNSKCGVTFASCFHRCDNWKPITKQKAENYGDFNCNAVREAYNEKHTDYNHCEEAKKAYACAMTNACPEKHYRPFESTDELIKVWEQKHRGVYPRPKGTMPLIWVRFRDCDIYDLITGFGRTGVQINAELVDWGELYNEYEFLDGSPCGVET